MEERIVKLEAAVEHIQSDVSEMRIDIRGIRSEMQELDRRVSTKIDGVKDSVASLALAMEKSFSASKVWWLLIAATLLGVMARGFKWI